jgi:hypothetical protein
MSLKIVRICFSLTIASVITNCSNSPSVSVEKNAEGRLATAQNYNGSVFKDIKALVWQNPYEKLPHYKVDKLRIHSKEFTNNSARTLDNHQDFINSDRPKIVHPNGVCLSGVWRINPENADNTYTGYFANGSTGLILARASTAGTEVDIEKSQITTKLTGKKYISYGFTGKIFPTVSLEDPKQYRPANFITQTDLGGQETADFTDVELMNAPNVTAMNRGIVGGGVEIFAKTGITFASVDQSTTIRQLYEIAELNKPASVRTNTPQYLKLVVSPVDRKKLGHGDFRLTLQDYIKRNKKISFDIYVANAGYTQTRTPLLQKTIIIEPWKKLGNVVFSDAVASKVCDFNLHFHHPIWREDRNDPTTTVRKIPKN